MRYLVGVDGGTQSTKVLIFDERGRVVARGVEPLKPLSLPREGVAEHPGDDLWDTLVKACRKALAALPDKAPKLEAVGLCTIRCCRVLLREDLSLANPVISWMDLRLARPYEREDPAVAYVTTTTGYIGARLTGRRIDTAANLLGQWPVDYRTWDWLSDEGEFKRFEIPRPMLFDLVKPGELVGTITKQAAEATGLPEGLPVAATASDKAVEALGSGPLGDRTGLLSLGTYVCSMIEGRDLAPDHPAYFTNMASIPMRFLYESVGVRRGMSTVSWVRELMGPDLERRAAAESLSPDDYLGSLAASIPAGSEGLMTVPEWLPEPSTPWRRGVMMGFSGRHGAVHMYRSVMEGIAMTMWGNLKAMCEARGFDIRRVIVSGGGSSGDLMMRIVADVSGRPSVRTEVNGAVALGSAICAAVCAGVHPGFDEAMAAMVRVKDVFEPDPKTHDFYSQLIDKVYSKLTKYTDEPLKLAWPLFDPKPGLGGGSGGSGPGAGG